MPPPAFRLPFSSLDCLSRLAIAIPDSSYPGKKPLGPARQKFTAQEDERLRNLVAKLGENNWTDIALELGTRSPRQCRERFKNYLSPNLKNEPWTDAEDRLLADKFSIFGAKWSVIVSYFPTRSEVNLKNRWTQLSNRGFWELDIDRERRQLIMALDSVIAGAAAQASAPVQDREPSGSEFSFGAMEWSDDGHPPCDFFDSF
jgi:hypothetical protein